MRRTQLLRAALFTVSSLLLMSCISFSTLQTAETLDPGEFSLGAGVSVLGSEDDNAGLLPEVGFRLGLTDRMDFGAKLFLPLALFVDAKVELLQQPLTVSFDMGYSTFTLLSGSGETRNRTTGYYPMLIAGKKHWYAGIKPMFIQTEGDISLFGESSSYEGGVSLLATDVLVGAVIGNHLRLMPEVNLLFPAEAEEMILIPGLALELKF